MEEIGRQSALSGQRLHRLEATHLRATHDAGDVVVPQSGEGFTPRERDLIANLARYHRKALSADRHTDYMVLDDEDQTLVRRLAALFATGPTAWMPTTSRSSRQPPWSTKATICLKLRARDTPDLDLWATERNGDLFELEFGRHIEPVAVEVT